MSSTGVLLEAVGDVNADRPRALPPYRAPAALLTLTKVRPALPDAVGDVNADRPRALPSYRAPAALSTLTGVLPILPKTFGDVNAAGREPAALPGPGLQVNAS